MSQDLCCVCSQPITRHIGHRPFCETHFAAATRENKGFERASIINLGVIAVYTLAVYLLATILPAAFVKANLVIIGLVVAIVPAALWLNFFYRQDRLEPEPHHYVIGVFLLAMLATNVIWRYVVDGLFRLDDWVAADNLSALLGNILVVGFLVQGIVYAVVRITVYATAEFDERMDGIVYGTAAGLGVATMLNVNLILDSGGVNLAYRAFQKARQQITATRVRCR